MNLIWQEKENIASNINLITEIKLHLEKYPEWKIPSIEELIYAYNIKENGFDNKHYFSNKNGNPYLIHFGKYYYSLVPLQSIISPYIFNIRLVK